MVFPSIPVYLDPSNWLQQPNQQQGIVTNDNPQLSPPPQPPPAKVGSGGGTGSIKPGSMVDRARLANIPQPESALKCPRCESTNTKFCYFNNYSLTQPRHFCKTCRRYWTRGGALRNVPVGGGCRRNRRSKGSSSGSKSPVISESQRRSSSSSSALASNGCTNILRHMPSEQLPPRPPGQLPIFPSLNHLNEYNSNGVGLNFGGIQAPSGEFHVGTSTSGAGAIFSGGLIEQLRLQQFPLLSSGLEGTSTTGLYPFGGDQSVCQRLSYDNNNIGQLMRSKALDSGVVTQSANVKMGENQGVNMSRNFLGISGSDQYWGGNAWTDLPGFTSSSSHLL